MKIKDLKINVDDSFSCNVNGTSYIGSFIRIGKFVCVTYMRNILKEKQTTTRIKVKTGMFIDELLNKVKCSI